MRHWLASTQLRSCARTGILGLCRRRSISMKGSNRARVMCHVRVWSLSERWALKVAAAVTQPKRSPSRTCSWAAPSKNSKDLGSFRPTPPSRSPPGNPPFSPKRTLIPNQCCTTWKQRISRLCRHSISTRKKVQIICIRRGMSLKSSVWYNRSRCRRDPR